MLSFLHIPEEKKLRKIGLCSFLVSLPLVIFFLTAAHGAGSFVVSNTASSGAGSFPQAVTGANAVGGGSDNPVTFTPAVTGTCNILANFPPGGLTSIITVDTSGLASPPFILDFPASTGIFYNGTGTAGINFTGTGTLNIEGSGGTGAFRNADTGTFSSTLSSGVLNFAGGNVFYNDGAGTMNFTLSGGALSGGTPGVEAAILFYNNGTLNFTLSGGTVTAAEGFLIYNSGNCPSYISGGTVNITGGIGFFNNGNSLSTYISGGTVNITGGRGFYNDENSLSTYISGGTVNITGGTGFYNGRHSLSTYISGGTVNITGGTGFENSGDSMLISVSGGTLYMDNSVCRGNEDITLAISGTGTFSSGVNGVTIRGTDLSFTPTATHQVAIGQQTGGGGPSLPVSLRVSSSATLGNAILNVTSTSPSNILAGNSYTIMATNTTSTITGTYGTLTSTAPTPLVYTVTYSTPPGAVQTVTVNVNADQSWASYVGSGAPPNTVTFATYLNGCSNLGNDPAFVQLNNYRLAGNTAAYDNALSQMQPSQMSAQGVGAFNNSLGFLNTVGGQVQAWLTDERGGRIVSGSPFASSDKTLAGIEPKRFQAFDQLVTRQITGGDNFASLLKTSGGKPQRHGIVGASVAQNFTNSPVEVNRHPLTAGRVRVGKANLWLQPYGQLTSQKGNSNDNPSIRTKTGGLVLGADYEVAQNTLLGVLGGTSTTPFTWGSGRGNGRMTSGFGGLYGAWKEGGGFYVEGQTIFGGNRFKTNRYITFSTINRTATAHHNAFQFTGNMELGYAFPAYDWFTMQPFILGDYMALQEQGYTETGAQALNIAVKSHTSQFLLGEIGAMVYKTFAWGETLLRPTAELGWMIRTPLSSTSNVRGGLINQPSTLVVTGVNKVYNQIAPGVGLLAQLANGTYVIGNVYAECGGGLNIGEALLRVGYEF